MEAKTQKLKTMNSWKDVARATLHLAEQDDFCMFWMHDAILA